MRKRKYVELYATSCASAAVTQTSGNGEDIPECPIPQCHNIVSTSQISISGMTNGIDLARIADLCPYTSYDKRRFAAITIRMANPHCTCLLFGSGKLVITGSTSFYSCIVASQNVTKLLRATYPMSSVRILSCVVQNIVAHVEFPPNTTIDLDGIYGRFCECTTYQRSIFPGLVLRPPQSPIVLLIFNSGRIVCTGGRSYDDIYNGFITIYRVLKTFIHQPPPPPPLSPGSVHIDSALPEGALQTKRRRKRAQNTSF